MEDSNVSKDQYGRKTWDVEAYAKPQKPDFKDQEQIKQISNKSTSQVAHRQKLIDELVSAINRHTIIDVNNKRKRFGFTCPICQLSYRDNMALVDHFNSPQHIKKATVGTLDGDDQEEVLEGGIRHASVDEVESMLKLLLEKSREKDIKTIEQRVEARRIFEKKRLEKRRAKRKKETSGDDEVARMMGFSEFR